MAVPARQPWPRRQPLPAVAPPPRPAVAFGLCVPAPGGPAPAPPARHRAV